MNDQTLRASAWIASVLIALWTLTGCGRGNAGGPPTLVLGDTVCDECGMIVSDERFATATIVEGPRGPEPRVFDDFNCQINYEHAHAEETIVARWSHDYLSSAWMPTEAASFLRSPGLRTPMGSGVAAFTERADAERVGRELQGEMAGGSGAGSAGVVTGFEAVWSELTDGG